MILIMNILSYATDSKNQKDKLQRTKTGSEQTGRLIQ